MAGMTKAKAGMSLLSEMATFTSSVVDIVIRIYERVKDAQRITEIVVTNKSNSTVRVTLSEDPSSTSKDFTDIASGLSMSFGVPKAAEMVYITVVQDPDGRNKEICRNHPCKVGYHPSRVEEFEVVDAKGGNAMLQKARRN